MKKELKELVIVRSGIRSIEGEGLKETDRIEYQTPCYVLHKEKLKQNIADFRNAFSSTWGSNFVMAYSIKTNHLPWLLKYAGNQGFMAEAVSDDEYHFACTCGFETSKIIFNGPQKGDATLINALNKKSIVNLDGLEEIDTILRYLKSVKDAQSELTLGLRVNFDLERVCPGETTAGQKVSRFGFCEENGELRRAVEILHKAGVKISGLHMHYSTTTRSSEVFAQLAQKACEVANKYMIAEEIKYIDIGGGFWGGTHSCNYPSPEEYAERIASQLKMTFNPQRVCLIIEPGASILATAVDYRCKVTGIKRVRDTAIVTTDGTSLHINPFQVKRMPVYMVHHILQNKLPFGTQIVCGNTCMENDRFFESDCEDSFSVGDELIFQFSGAYTMAFNNCFINVPPAVYVRDCDKGKSIYHCIRKRQCELMMSC